MYDSRKFSDQGNHKIEAAFIATVNDGGETFPKVNAALSYESMQVRRLLPDGELTNTETVGQMLDSEGSHNFAHNVKFGFSSEQADNLTWFNTIKLARGLVAVYGLNKAGMYINWIPQTTNDFDGTADGSLIDGLTMAGTKRTIGKDVRKIEYMFQGRQFPVHLAWQYNSTQLSAYATGTATTGGRSLVDVSAAAYRRPGMFTLTPDGASQFGFFEEFTQVEELIGGEIQNNIQVVNDMKVTLTFAGRQFSGPQALAHGLYAADDFAWVAKSYANETFTYPSGTMRGSFKISSGHKGPRMEGELTVTLALNTSDGSPNHINIASATAATYTY